METFGYFHDFLHPHYSLVTKFYPICFLLAMKITTRHNILYESIGYLPEEQESFINVWLLAGISLFCVILFTCFEAMLFILYNEKYHPFANIIVNQKINDETIPLDHILNK